MTPEERHLLEDLFKRIESAAQAPRDPEAESLIQESIRAHPYAPYLLAQSLLVQDYALRAAQEKIQALESQLKALKNAQPEAQQPPSFLQGVKNSLFGTPASVPAEEPAGKWNTSARNAPPPSSPSPWGGGPGGGPAPWPAAPPTGGSGFIPPSGGGSGTGSFLKGALGTAAGVAGGVLLAESLQGLFSSHASATSSLFGTGAGSAFGLNTPSPSTAPQETVINNYYENSDAPSSTEDVAGEESDAGFYDTDEEGDFGGGDDGGYDV